MLALSIAGGALRAVDGENKMDVEGAASLLPTFVSPEAQALFEADDGKRKKQLLDVLETYWKPVLSALGSDKNKFVTAINKKALSGQIGQSNKTVTTSGPGKPLRISIDASRVEFDQSVVTAFLLFEGTQEKDKVNSKLARQLAVEFAMLCVERVLDDRTKFDALFGALDKNSWVKIMLQKNPASWQSRKGEKFFDEARLSAIGSNKLESGKGGGGTTSTGDAGSAEEDESVDSGDGDSPGVGGTTNEPNVTIRRSGSEHSFPLTMPEKVVTELGLGRGASVTVIICRLEAAERPTPAVRVWRASKSRSGSDSERDISRSGDGAETSGRALDNGEPRSGSEGGSSGSGGDAETRGRALDNGEQWSGSDCERGNSGSGDDAETGGGAMANRLTGKRSSESSEDNTARRRRRSESAGNGRITVAENTQNFSSGGGDFRSLKLGGARTDSAPSPVKSPVPSNVDDNDPETVNYIKLIKDKIGTLRDAHTRRANGAPMNVSEISTAFNTAFGSTAGFRNVWLTTKASDTLMFSTVYAFLPVVLRPIAPNGTFSLDVLRKSNKAKYIFSPGNKFGSLVDLVCCKHDTTFPMTLEDAARVWNPAVVQERETR
ncbi:unnamed protein product, partial [Ectocarpus sp. 4 AP-2014]